jgi:hypothetical protein
LLLALFGIGRKKPVPERPDHGHEAVLRLLDEKEQQGDEVTRLQVAGRALFGGVTNMISRPDRGARIDDLLGILGATGGFACIVGALHSASRAGEVDEHSLAIATAKDGRKYYFGNLPNRQLMEDRLSLLSLTLGAAQAAGAVATFDSVHEVVKRTASTVGTPDFGTPDLPNEHRPGDSFDQYVRYLWPKVCEALDLYKVNPEGRASAIGFAIQSAIDAGKSVLDPATAAQIVIEYAVPAAKLDPAEFEAA